MTFKIHFYGTSAAVPSLKRGFACIGLIRDSSNPEVSLFDCGDGSLAKILGQGTDVLSIARIFVTHYHSDHLSGIVQLIETMGIRKRTADLDIFAPRGLKDYFETIERITRVAANRRFQIRLHELDAGSSQDFEEFSISSHEMRHTVPCLGYRVESEKFTLAYTGDTEPCDGIVNLAKDSDCLIHEATYLEKDTDKARQTKHSTAKEAARAAANANSKNLILTHVNDDCETENEMAGEALSTFENVEVARDGFEIEL